MKKVLIEIVVPAADISYNIEAPLSMTISDLTVLVCRTVRDSLYEKFIPDDTSLLYDASTKKILNANSLIGELNIKNGSKLILL